MSDTQMGRDELKEKVRQLRDMAFNGGMAVGHGRDGSDDFVPRDMLHGEIDDTIDAIYARLAASPAPSGPTTSGASLRSAEVLDDPHDATLEWSVRDGKLHWRRLREEAWSTWYFASINNADLSRDITPERVAIWCRLFGIVTTPATREAKDGATNQLLIAPELVVQCVSCARRKQAPESIPTGCRATRFVAFNGQPVCENCIEDAKLLIDNDVARESVTTPSEAPGRRSADALTENLCDQLRLALQHQRGDSVVVNGAQYHGPGVVSDRTEYGTPIVWTDDRGPLVAVEIPNGNVWLYRASEVSRLTPTDLAAPSDG